MTTDNFKEKRKNGYTLVELLVYIALLGVISLVIIGVFMTISRASSKANVLIEINSNSYSAMERMIYEIKNASYVYTPTSNFINYNYNSGKPSQLSLATPLDLSANETSGYIDFYLENNTIFLKKDGVNPIALTSDSILVQSLSFSYFKNDKRESVKIDFTAHSTNALNPNASIHLVTTAALRS